MPGPPPKAPGLRQRRNKASTRARLSSSGRPPRDGVRPPALPIRGCACGGPAPEPARKKKRGRGRPRNPAPVCGACNGTGVVPWNPQVKAWWARLWSSPMAAEYIEADLDALFMLASLKDEFWTRSPGNGKLAGEIRQEEARFGLTPLDRRRLEWGLDKPPEDDDDGKGKADDDTPVVDPRVAMRLVK
jgi:hypothetical protein